MDCLYDNSTKAYFDKRYDAGIQFHVTSWLLCFLNVNIIIEILSYINSYARASM